MIKYFTIYGERCSGTNFIEKAILKNFDLNITWKYGWKHFFGYNSLDKSEDVLFIAIIRNPYEWIGSLFLQPHSLALHLRKNIYSFLTTEIISYHTNEKDKFKNEIMEDRNIYNKKRYKNLFELRTVKNKFLLNDMQKKVNNYYLITYENFCNNYDKILTDIENKFNLVRKNKNFLPVHEYKGYLNFNFSPIKYNLSNRVMNLINNNLNWKIENKLGYYKRKYYNDNDLIKSSFVLYSNLFKKNKNKYNIEIINKKINQHTNKIVLSCDALHNNIDITPIISSSTDSCSSSDTDST